MTKTKISSIIGATILCLGTYSIAKAEIVIGIAGPMTGSVAFLGEQQDIGAKRAVADINAAGGVLGQQISTVVVDDACDGEQSAAAAAQLIAAKVAFVNGHICSGASIAASGLYEDSKIIMMSPASTNPRVTDDGGKNVFRVIGRDDDQAVVGAEFLATEYADKNIAVVGGTNPYGAGLAKGVLDELKKRGVEPAMVATFESDGDSYDGIVDQLVASEIDIAYLISNSPSDMGLIALQARELLPEIQFLSGDALSGDDYLLVAGEAGVGTLFTFGPDARLLPSAAVVTEAIREEDFFEPAGYTLYSYTAVQTWAQAVEKAGTTDYVKVIKALEENEFDTVIGKIGFNEKGDVTGVANFVFYEYGEETYTQK